MSELSNVQAVRSQLIASVRTYSEEQAETWQLVPWLALQADGRDGGMGHYSHAYENGMWELHIAHDHMHHVCIDCATGVVTFLAFRPNRVFGPVCDDTIVRLSNHLEHLDAKAVVASLQAKISEPLPMWISKEEAGIRETERTRIQRQLNLSERYVRPEQAKAA